MQLFYAPDIMPPLYALGEEESKHCVRVLRLRRGGRIHITDGRGNLFCCEITDDDPKRCTVRDRQRGRGVRKNALCADSWPSRRRKAPTVSSGCWRRPPRSASRSSCPLDTAHSERHVFKPAAGREGHHRSPETVAESLPPGAAAPHALPRSGAAALRGTAFHRPLRPARSPEGKAYLPDALRAGEAAAVFIGPEGDFSPEEIDFALARRVRGDHPRHPASPHRNGGPRGRGHGGGGQPA